MVQLLWLKQAEVDGKLGSEHSYLLLNESLVCKFWITVVGIAVALFELRELNITTVAFIQLDKENPSHTLSYLYRTW